MVRHRLHHDPLGHEHAEPRPQRTAPPQSGWLIRARRRAARRPTGHNPHRLGAVHRNARPHPIGLGATLAEAVISEADEAGASAIVMGSRGLGSLLMSSISHAIVQHAEQPVSVVPSPDVALERSVKRHAHHTTV
jgi:hypothetical protein